VTVKAETPVFTLGATFADGTSATQNAVIP